MRVVSLHGPVLALPGQAGRVLSVHQRAVNLELADGTVLSLVEPSLGNGPGAVLVEADWPLDLRPGDGVLLGGGWITGPGLGLLVAGASRWEPAVAPGLGAGAAVRLGWEKAVADCWGAQVGEGLLPVTLRLLGQRAGARANGATTVPHQQILAELASPGLLALRAGRWTEAVSSLVGLGPGLTPSGDDLLAGFACLAHRAGWDGAAGLAATLRALPHGRTTTLSHALLRWAADGVASERALVWADRLLAGAPAPLGPVLAIGATSGADWVAGALLGLDSYLKEVGA